MRKYVGWIELGFFLLVLAVLFFTSRQRFFFDPGTFWHTRTGEEILAHGFIDTDPFTYSQSGRTWIPSQWLAEVLMAAVHQLASLDGLLWLALLVLAGFYAWLAGRFTLAGCHPLLTALFLVLFFSASCYHYHVRPHLATLVFLGVLCGLLTDVEAKHRSLWSLLVLVPVFVLWVNLHGGVLGGMVTLGLAGVGWGLWFLLGWPSPLRNWRDVGLLAIVGVLCAATVLVNPYGWRMVETWREILQQDLPNIIAEHRPLAWDQPEAWAITACAGIYLFVLAGTLPHRPRVVWLLPLVWLVQAYLRVRNGPLFAAVALVAMADMLPHCRWFLALAQRSDLFVPPQPANDGKSARGWRHLWLVLVPLPFLLPNLIQGGLRLDAEHWPLDLLPTLRQELRQPGAVVCNDDVFGGFLNYFVPEVKTFIDDRCELHGRDLLLEYVRLHRGTPEEAAEQFELWDRKYHFTYVLTRSSSTLAECLRKRSGWRLLGETSGEPDKRVSFFRKISSVAPTQFSPAVIAAAESP